MPVVIDNVLATEPRIAAAQATVGNVALTGHSTMIDVVGLRKVYPGGTVAVDSIHFSVGAGEFFGFLGPNGAGKTTTIRILATLLAPTDGRATVAGLDVATHPADVRRRVGFAMQNVAVDQLSTGRENLELIGRLHRVPGRELRTRVDELLELMSLTEVARRPAGTYSGGMKRRLDLASALVHRPQVLFLDEPTEGLDPQSRSALWAELARVNATGTTMFLTTHYMEEADRLCGRLAIIDQGRIVSSGTPAELKRSIGSERVVVRLGVDGAEGLVGAQDAAERSLGGMSAVSGVERTPDGVILSVQDAEAATADVLRCLDGGRARVTGLSIEKPSLDDVFLHVTGRRIRTEAADQPLNLGWM